MTMSADASDTDGPTKRPAAAGPGEEQMARHARPRARPAGTTGIAAIGAAALLACIGPAHADDALAAVKRAVAIATAANAPWTGPTTGPRAVAGKTVVYVAGDLRNGGIQGVSDGVRQAGAKIGWTIRVLDGQGSISGIQSALGQAVALKPDAIVVGGFDVKQTASSLAEASARGIKLVAWHGGPTPGPMAAQSIFYNVTSDNRRVAEIAADYAIARSDGHAAAVVFADSAYAMALLKGRIMESTVRGFVMASAVAGSPGDRVLAFEDTPLADTSTRMGPLTTSLLQRFGTGWTYSLAINDLYYDFMAPALISAGRDGDGPPVNISAGDGSRSAFERIRAHQFQAATVPEPLLLHGWQVVDELNRDFAGQPASGYVTPVHLVTADNVDADGGRQDVYDPADGYRDVYAKIWGK